MNVRAITGGGRRWFGWALLVLLLSGLAGAAVPAEVGVVVVHGKTGSPRSNVAKLAEALRQRRYLVAAPTMPWARGRIYAASYGEAMRELEGVAAGLRANGARLIFVAGHSLGANAALGFAAGHRGLAGLVLLAPGHFPDDAGYQRHIAPYRQQALRLAEAGRGQVVAVFRDALQGFMIDVRATPLVYLSYVDPEGPAVMSRNAAAIKQPLPVLFEQENNPAVAAMDQRIYGALPRSDEPIPAQPGHACPGAGCERDRGPFLDRGGRAGGRD